MWDSKTMTTMKQHIILLASAVLTLCSCSDYLKEDSGDLLIPEKVSEYESVLYGEGYPNDFTDGIEWIDLMTDDAECSTTVHRPSQNQSGDDNSYLATGRGPFCWAQDIEYYITSYSAPYENAYSNIMACNIVLENFQTMIGEEQERNYVAAQAYMLRAYSYFCLVNWYGEPYNEATADTDLGVVIRTHSQVVRDQPQRSSVAEVYERINTDLDSALFLFDNAKKENNVYKVSKKATQLLKSRVALYQGKWEDVIKYGTALSDDDYNLYGIQSKTNSQLSHDVYYNFLSTDNTEVIWMFGGKPSMSYNPYMYNGGYINGAAFATSQSSSNGLIHLYGDGDMRIYAFFLQDDDYCWRYLCYKHWSWTDYSQAFRTSEALLNVAEASVQLGDTDEAIRLLNLLRSKRIKRSRYVALTAADFSSASDLLDYVRTERRRELCFEENHRWWDLRRYGCPALTHVFYASKNASPQTYKLEEGDRNYTLELPKSELNYNTNIQQINRRVISAE